MHLRQKIHYTHIMQQLAASLLQTVDN